MKIAVVRPGHALSTLFVSQGMEEGLRNLGVEVSEVRTERLISMQTRIVTQFRDIYQPVAEQQGCLLNDIALQAAWENVLARLLYIEYDLILVVNGKLITPWIMRGLSKLPGPRVIWLTESPYEDDYQEALIEHFDFAFTNDQSSVERLSRITPTVYLPHSYDPETFLYIEREPERDVFFCYTAFNNRVPVVEALSSSGLDVFLPKSGTVTDDNGVVGVRFISPEWMSKYYTTSKINLNVHRTETFYGSGQAIDQAYSLGPRAYEIAACGAFQLCDNTRPELAEVFGDTVATYDNPDDVVEQCRFWLDPARDKARRDMGLASLERVQNCTYMNRAGTVMNQLAKWYNQPDWLVGLGEAHEQE